MLTFILTGATAVVFDYCLCHNVQTPFGADLPVRGNPYHVIMREMVIQSHIGEYVLA